MQDRPNYPFYNNNSLKDMNQLGQGGSNKQGKKTGYKYYKGDTNKNTQNNMDEKMNINSGDHNQNYPHYRQRQNRKNFQEINSNPSFKKKKQKKRDNNDFQYQNNNTSEISQSSKDEYLDQQNSSNINNNSNNHQNLYNKQYKKNQMIFNNNNNINNHSMNNSINNMSNMNNLNNNMNINNNLGNINNNLGNINNSGNSNPNLNNINNPNLTPQRRNQITTPFGFSQNLSNSKNMNSPNFNLNNKSPIISQQSQNPQQLSQNQMYINPNIFLMGAMRQSLSMNDNDQEMNIKDEKSNDNLSEEALSSRQTNPQSEGNNLNQEMLMNSRFLQQQHNYITMPYNMNNMNNINNINNINNMNSINNSLGNINNMNNINNNYNNINNNIQNLSNYNQNLGNQINTMNLNNLGNLKNLSMGNFQMPMYDQQNNQLFNAVMASNMKQNFSLQMNDEMNVNNHKKMKKMPNQSPNDQNFNMNPSLNLGVLPNLNYNGPNINNNTNINNKKISLSSQPPKNTIPNFNQGENLNLVFNQNKLNQQGISPLLNMNMNSLGNKTFYIPQNMKNNHMNNNMWNNLNNNNVNNSHLNGPNTNINNVNINENYNGNKNNNLYKKKDFNNNRTNHNNNPNNNKKYHKLYNHNAYQPSNNNNTNNNHINNKLNIDTNNNNGNLSNSNNSLKKNSNNISNQQSNVLRSNKPSKQYLISLCLKLDNNETEIINIKSLKDTNALLQEIKEKRNLNEKMVKLIQNKIIDAVDIIQKIFDYNLNKYTYKNLTDINYQINHKQKLKEEIYNKRNKSSKTLNKYFDERMKLSINDVKQVESLNISY